MPGKHSPGPCARLAAPRAYGAATHPDTDARRSLSSTTTDVDYQVTLNDDSATDASVKSKIESGSVSGSSIQAAAQQEGATSLSNADASQIQASQKAEEQTFEAEPPSASSGSSGMGAGALAGIVAVIAGVLLILVCVMVKKERDGSPIFTTIQGGKTSVSA